MSAIPQQVLNSQKAAIDTLVAVQNSVFNGFEKLVDLNLKVIKATIDDVSEKSQQVAAVKDAQEAVALSSSLVQPGTDKAVAYSKHVYDIISAVQADLAKLGETQVAEAQKHINDAVEQMTKNAPAGSENAVAMLKSSLAQASGAFDAMTNERIYSKPKSREQAAEEILRCAGTQFDPTLAKMFVGEVLGL